MYTFSSRLHRKSHRGYAPRYTHAQCKAESLASADTDEKTRKKGQTTRQQENPAPPPPPPPLGGSIAGPSEQIEPRGTLARTYAAAVYTRTDRDKTAAPPRMRRQSATHYKYAHYIPYVLMYACSVAVGHALRQSRYPTYIGYPRLPST